MKKFTAIFGLLLALSGVVFADSDVNIPFSVGEKLTYQIFWGPFVVGRGTLEVAGIEPIDGHACYHLIAKAKTSGLAELLFPVDSTAESWLDCTGLFAREYHEDRTEGKHHKNNQTHFDYASKETVTKSLINGREHRTPLDQHVQDVISSLYYVRTQKLLLDSDQSFMINAANTNYNVTVRPDLRKSMWVRPVGDIEALRIEPTPTLNIVSANNGRMWFWISDDARHLPLLVSTELKLGSAKLVLFSITPGTGVQSSTNKPADSVRSAPLSLNAGTLASER